jgi:elongation factor G
MSNSTAKEYATDRLRNVALLGHTSAGKTTFAEALLFAAGNTTRLGSVDDCTTVSDFDAEEKRRKQSVYLSLAPVEWKGYKFNLLDAPGYADFYGEVVRAVRAADMGLIFVDAASGVEVGTELAMQALENAHIPGAVMISRMDRDNADFARVLGELHEAFHQDIVPLMIPVGAHHDFSGVIDLVSRRYLKGPQGEVAAIPADMADAVHAARQKLMEAAAEGEDALLEKWFSAGTLTDDEFIRGLRSAIRRRTFVPVFCSAPTQMIGVHAMLFALANYAPMPFDLGADPDDGAHGQILHVFKTSADPFVGKISFVRVIEGPLRNGELRLLDTRTEAEERIPSLFLQRGEEQIPAPVLHVGDLGAITKVAGAQTGDTLCDRAHARALPPIDFPHPLYAVAVQPKSRNDAARLSVALVRLVEEDPSLRVTHEPGTHETVLWGMGQAHIDVAVHHLHTKFAVDVETSVPRIPYRETVTKRGQARHRHKKQTGGAGQFAEVELAIEPTAPGVGYEFQWKVFGGVISNSYAASIEKGIKQKMESGVLAGYPVTDVRCTVTDGREHAVDSKPIAFEIAARAVFREAFAAAGPVLLEPIYAFTITVPEQFAGDVMGGLKGRRAQILGMEQRANKTVITAQAPLAEMQRYSTDLRSLTQGRGFYETEFDHYAPAPAQVAQAVIAAHTPGADES